MSVVLRITFANYAYMAISWCSTDKHIHVDEIADSIVPLVMPVVVLK